MSMLKASIAALFVGVATTSVAQTTAQSFADQFRTMQSLQSFGMYTFKPAPTFSSRPNDPVVRESFADAFGEMQAEASNSAQWSPSSAPGVTTYARGPADEVGRESFTDMFARMQAASSNSGEWNLRSTRETIGAGETGAPSFAQRFARGLHEFGTGPTRSN